MADALVPAVVPRSGRRLFSSEDAVQHRMSIPGVAAVSGGATMLYRIAAVDERGRIAECSVVQTLGWCSGQRLQFGLISSTVIAVQSDPAGVFALARRSHIPLPLAARRWCHLETGDRVLLAAAPDHGTLVIYTMSALEDMVTTFHSPAAGGDSS